MNNKIMDIRINKLVHSQKHSDLQPQQIQHAHSDSRPSNKASMRYLDSALKCLVKQIIWGQKSESEQSARTKSIHKGVNYRSKCVTQVQQLGPESKTNKNKKQNNNKQTKKKKKDLCRQR